MHAERAVDETAKFRVPKDLVAEMSSRASARSHEFYQLEHFKPSFFGRIARLFSGKRK